MDLKTRQKWYYSLGYARNFLHWKLKNSFWWNLIVYGIIFGLIALGLRIIILNESDPRVGSASAISLVSDTVMKPQAGKKKGGCCISTAQFHRQFRAGKFGVWHQRRKFTRSFHRAWVRSANRHLHYKHLANQYYYTMIRTTNCQTQMGNLPDCNMPFPSVRYNWLHPADNSAGRKWTLRIAWCGAVAVTEYYTAGRAGATLRAVGGKALAECLPSFLIP